MGFIRSLATYVATEVVNTRYDLVKAGLLTPTPSYDPKSSLVDPYGYHSLTAYGYKERYSILDYSKLKQISFADPIIAAIVQVRLNQVASFALAQTDRYKTGFKVVLRDREKEPTKAEKSRCREFQEFILNCGIPETFEETPERKKREKLPTFLRKLVRDSLVYDQCHPAGTLIETFDGIVPIEESMEPGRLYPRTLLDYQYFPFLFRHFLAYNIFLNILLCPKALVLHQMDCEMVLQIGCVHGLVSPTSCVVQDHDYIWIQVPKRICESCFRIS